MNASKAIVGQVQSCNTICLNCTTFHLGLTRIEIAT
jgi:hypothetical protein